MTQEHPITPSEELVRDWLNNMRSDDCIGAYPHDMDLLLATQAARWGADQELEACCEWIDSFQDKFVHSSDLCLVRRPKPLSLKEKALLQLDTLNTDLGMHGLGCDLSQIRRALESLPD